MGLLSRQKINDFYDQFRPVEVLFTKEVVQTTGLVAKEIQLKCASDFFPCVIYSTSFEAAKVIANNRSGLLAKIRGNNNSLSIRFFFKVPSTDEQIVFLVPARMTTFSPYGTSAEMSTFTLEFTSRPPDDLIEIMGRIMEANMNFTKRKDERVPVTPETMRKIGLTSKDISAVIDATPRRCIARDLFFSGARVVTLGDIPVEADRGEQQVSFHLDFTDPREECMLHGRLIRSDAVVDGNNMYILTVRFDDPVPMAYKVRINDYLSALKPDRTEKSDGGELGLPSDELITGS